MKVLIIGAGRMGIRHAQGITTLPEVEYLMLIDKTQFALDNAKNILANNNTPIEYALIDVFEPQKKHFDVVIIAATATNRKQILSLAKDTGCKQILIEKPVGQSMQEVQEIIDFADTFSAKVYVNLNMRIHEGFMKLQQDLNNLTQYQGDKVISVNTGTIGIGANGIHYLDAIFFLLNATKAEFIAGEIEETIIPSGRGAEFGDFGGWCTIKLYDDSNIYKGRVHFSMTSQSSVFGSWDIITPHGKISIDEVLAKRIDWFRKPESNLPIYRYAADYLPPQESVFPSPFLGDLTAQWLKGLMEGKELLPSLAVSMQAHKILFQWLSLSKTHQDKYPIT